MINGLMLESMRELPLAVMNLGIEDLFWWQNLSEGRVGDTQIISTNLVSETSGLPQPAKYAIVTVPADQTSLGRDVRIGFLGIADPKRVKPNARFRGVDPLEAVAAVKDDVMAKADFLIVLADVRRGRGAISPDSVLRKLAENHPEIVAILVTERRYRLYDPVQINSATILSSVERGRYLGQLTLELGSSGDVTGVRSDFVELKEGVPEVDAFRSKAEWINVQLP
jgi:2',3'-cyclic-nucleotide 2'-phosphodiesterase (5'-nucleotidase family)